MFFILHLFAFCLFPLALFITIPLHLIHANQKNSKRRGTDDWQV